MELWICLPGNDNDMNHNHFIYMLSNSHTSSLQSGIMGANKMAFLTSPPPPSTGISVDIDCV